jgi:hypothetical protein
VALRWVGGWVGEGWGVEQGNSRLELSAFVNTQR